MGAFFALLIGVGVCFVVMCFSYKYYARLNFFLSMENLLNGMKVNISFLQKDILSILETNKSKRSATFDDLLYKYKQFLQDNDTDKFGKNIKSLNNLNSEEQEHMLQYFLTLGHSDCNTQTSATQVLTEYVAKRVECCRQDIKQKAMIIQKLSIIVGLAVFILLV